MEPQSELERYVSGLDFTPPEWEDRDSEYLFAKLNSRLGSQPVVLERAAGSEGKKPMFSTGVLPRWAGYAAVACILVISSVWVGRNHHILVSNSEGNVSPKYRAVATGIGERATIKLADGSSVILAPKSRLSYTRDFGSGNRDIELVGEALFTVVNSTGTPLVVRTGNTSTRVLGTTFSVRNYSTDTTIKVVVAQGKVIFDQNVLSTGDIGISHRNRNVEVIRESNVAAMLAWADGKIVFDNAPIKDVIPELERWYDMRITVTNPRLLNETILLTLSNETAPDALRVIAYTMGAQLKISGRTAVLSPQ